MASVYFSYVDTAKHLSPVSKEISEISVTAINVGGCNFTSDLCSWRSNDGGWKLSLSKKGIHAQGKGKPTILESPWMFGDAIYKSTGLCLSFSYLLSTKSESSLTVFVLTSSNSSIWRLNGFHGDSWHNAQVQFAINGNFMVLFMADGKNASNTYHLAVDKIDIASKPCNRIPLYSDPGFTCNFQDEFQCENGPCVSKDLVCDGDSDCLDNSDERDCTCSATKFACPSGECISIENLCDSKSNCQDGTDESRCGTSWSKDKFSCASGRCISWALTCNGEKNCEDGADEPFACSIFPGKYIFIESSDYETSSVTAVLASGVVDSSERTCIQFWYHMRGREIGILNVYIRTNETRALIWQLAGEQGDNWNFGQVGYKGDSPYEILLEAVFGKGIHGDIAVDDLYFSNEEDCPTTYGNESPNCLFEMNHCAWRASNNWKISQVHPPTPKRQDWQASNGKFISIDGTRFET
ncbi:PREDICTED: MAM and LDL-receptor class A domain-containing protein 1-like [Acropora digitifera]|uniref:MAM and LDL-receptor class A domain-containing protein 1-like n=1 Tax=Acropora digitifera TaxID=70779 RepID=UPI00077AB160|nr:PREDICTED: MAM and LDL-receptor class A domain-containing protein 1-like [Acropora digitifera]